MSYRFEEIQVKINQKYRDAVKRELSETNEAIEALRDRCHAAEQTTYAVLRERVEYEHVALGLWTLLQPFVRAEIEAVLAEAGEEDDEDGPTVNEVRDQILAQLRAPKVRVSMEEA